MSSSRRRICSQQRSEADLGRRKPPPPPPPGGIGPGAPGAHYAAGFGAPPINIPGFGAANNNAAAGAHFVGGHLPPQPPQAGMPPGMPPQGIPPGLPPFAGMPHPLPGMPPPPQPPTFMPNIPVSSDEDINEMYKKAKLDPNFVLDPGIKAEGLKADRLATEFTKLRKNLSTCLINHRASGQGYKTAAAIEEDRLATMTPEARADALAGMEPPSSAIYEEVEMTEQEKVTKSHTVYSADFKPASTCSFRASGLGTKGAASTGSGGEGRGVFAFLGGGGRSAFSLCSFFSFAIRSCAPPRAAPALPAPS